MQNKIWIWNSMASRRRSASDIFEENGLEIINSFLLSKKIDIKLFDWANMRGYKGLSPGFLLRLNYLFCILAIVFKKAGGLKQLSSYLQDKLGKIQRKRLKLRLTNLAKQLSQNQVPILGIKVWYGEAFTMSKFLANQVKKYSPETIVVAGGYHPTLYEEDILKYSNFDFAVAGSGEEALFQLIKLIPDNYSKQNYLENIITKQSQDPINGLIYRSSKKIKLNPRKDNIRIKASTPSYKRNSGKIKVHILLESLGCPWNKCSFCVHNKFSPDYRSRQVEDVVFEIREMLNQGIGLFRFAGSDTPPAYGKQIANEILKQELHLEFTMGCRAVKNCSDNSIYSQTVKSFEIMIRSGLRGVFIGGETGNDFINKSVMNKGIDAEDLSYTLKAIREAEKQTGIKCSVSLAMIYPTPLLGDISHKHVLEDNLKLIELTRPDSVMVSPPGPFKGTDWYNHANKYGFELKPDFIEKIMEYEYVLYKPLDTWPEIPFNLKGMDFKETLMASQDFKNQIEMRLGIPTDLSDEHFLMIRASGELSLKRILAFKKRTLLSIITSNYRYINQVGRRINTYSKNLALSNFN